MKPALIVSALMGQLSEYVAFRESSTPRSDAPLSSRWSSYRHGYSSLLVQPRAAPHHFRVYMRAQTSGPQYEEDVAVSKDLAKIVVTPVAITSCVTVAADMFAPRSEHGWSVARCCHPRTPLSLETRILVECQLPSWVSDNVTGLQNTQSSE